MSGNITWEMVFGLAAIFGAMVGLWLRIEQRIKTHTDGAELRALGAQAKADALAGEFSEYKLHVAEIYATRNSVTLQFDSVATSISNLGQRVEQRLDGMNERLDRVIEAGQKQHPVRRASN